jgi:acyl dehydratase
MVARAILPWEYILLLLTYKVRARNTSSDSENKIHDDAVAATYGFRGGLVPGVTIYGYMTTPIVARFGMKWLERGSMQVRFLNPLYEGDLAIVRANVDMNEKPISASIRVEREDGGLCASGVAKVDDESPWLGEVRIEDFPETPLPEPDQRPEASPEAFVCGLPLGTVNSTLDLYRGSEVDAIEDKLTFYRGTTAVAHPFVLLGQSNRLLTANFKLGPWIHASSDLINWSTARDNDELSVRGRVRDCFERRGHGFVVLDVLLLANRARVVQQVRHTAIYRPRQIS